MASARRLRYRKWGSMKGTRELRAQVGPEVFEFFDSHATDPHGAQRSRGKTLELMVELVENLAGEASDSRTEVCTSLLDAIIGDKPPQPRPD